MCSFRKMLRFALAMATLVLGLGGEVTSAPTDENVELNVIDYDDLSEHLAPPAADAYNHYNAGSPRSEVEYPYTVEISASHVTIKTGELPDQEIKLTRAEAEGIRKVSLSIVALLDSSKLASGAPESAPDAPDAPGRTESNPVIVLTNSGVSLRFANASEPSSAAEMPAEHKRILWDFLAKYTKNVLEEKLRELNVSDGVGEVVDSPAGSSPFENFTGLLWRVVKFSVNYAERNFEGWTTTPGDDVAPETDKALPGVDTLFAYEEISPFHEFPSQEFHFRRKDVDSIFYGRGVI